MIVLLASDLTDNLVLDFSPSEASSEYDLEIDVCGDQWHDIDY